MNLANLNKVAVAMVTPGKGILAADESTGTIKKRFDAINDAPTGETRRDRQPPNNAWNGKYDSHCLRQLYDHAARHDHGEEKSL
jgi:fructose-bisphosphate aldolase class 1